MTLSTVPYNGFGGWYKFMEPINIEKWIDEYYELEKQKKQELINSGKIEPKQTSLF